MADASGAEAVVVGRSGAGSSADVPQSGAEAPSNASLSSPQRIPPMSPTHLSVAKEVGYCAYAGYYTLAFFAYFFGSAQYFDADGDGDFDAADMQLMMDRGWRGIKVFFMVPEKQHIDELKRRKLEKGMSNDALEKPASPDTQTSGNSQSSLTLTSKLSKNKMAKQLEDELQKKKQRHNALHQQLETGLGEGNDGDGTTGSARGRRMSATDAMNAEIATLQAEIANIGNALASSTDLTEEQSGKHLKQHRPWFTLCEAFIVFLLWFIFACQASSYTLVSTFCRFDEGEILQQWTNNEKTRAECEQECAGHENCKAIAWVDAIDSRCALLSAYTLGELEGGICNNKVYDIWFWIRQFTKDEGGIGAVFNARAGLDSIIPGKTTLVAYKFCEESYAYEVLWRLLLYQFTHGGLAHVLSNVLMILALGIPLEGSLGTRRLFFLFNIGVIGGGLNWICFDPHRETYGASGGCYALLGICLADLVINWSQKKFRYMLLGFLFILAFIDFIGHIGVQQEDTGNSGNPASHTTHYGGALAGVIIGVVAGPNLVVKDWEKVMQKIVLGLGTILILFSLIWWFTNPLPGVRDIWDLSYPAWCWQGQAYFGAGGWPCVECDTRECVEGWYDQESKRRIGPITFSRCQTQGVLDVSPWD